MNWITFWMIMGIMFWVLLALVVVCFMVWIYCQVQYYKWDKEDRDKESMLASIKNIIVETIEEQKNFAIEMKEERWGENKEAENNPGGGISDAEI